jgi:hypothetical protein
MIEHDVRVIDKAFRLRAARLGSATMGMRLGGFIYGTIVVLAVIVAGAKAYPQSAGHIVVLVVVTSLVLWLAHVYAHGLAQTVANHEHLSFSALRHIAGRERSIAEAALPPVGALLLGAFGLVSTAAAVWAALVLGLVVLAVQGFAVARIERLGWLGTLAVVVTNLGLGLLMIGLKLVLIH